MVQTDVERLKGRLAAAQAELRGKPSARELELAAQEIEALWDELDRHADRLALERERNAALFEHAPFACLITDIHGNVREANLAAIALLQLPAGYVAGKPLAIFIAEEDREAFRMRLALAARALKAPIEGWAARVKSATGAPRAVKIDLRPMPPESANGLSLLWFMRDLE